MSRAQAGARARKARSETSSISKLEGSRWRLRWALEMPLADHDVRVPIKAAIPPAPWAKEIANGHEEAKADRAADEDPGLRRKENNRRVIVGHRNKSRMHGLNRDVRAIADDDLVIAAQISVVLGLPALSLHRIHHVLLLRLKRVAKISGPTHVVGHHLEHRREGQKRLHTGIPGKMIRLDRVGQSLSGKVVVLIGPARRIGNLVGIR
jgi:hypothetical protein